MSETQTTQHDQNAQNQELLRRSELGVLLSRAYLSAINLSPRLADIQLMELPADSKHIATASPRWRAHNTTGNHVVSIHTENIDELLEHYEQELAIRPEVVEHVSSMLHIEPEQMTPQLFYVFSILHEMGHTDDYFEHEDNPDEFEHNVKVSRESLPLGWVTTNDLLDPGSDVHKRVMADTELFDRHGVTTIHELAALNLTAYRNMRHERYADEFAAEVLLYEPELMDQLMRDTIEPYRNHPGFGAEAA